MPGAQNAMVVAAFIMNKIMNLFIYCWAMPRHGDGTWVQPVTESGDLTGTQARSAHPAALPSSEAATLRRRPGPQSGCGCFLFSACP